MSRMLHVSCATLVLLLAAAPCPPARCEQVLANPGFEDVSAATPAGWTANGPVSRSSQARSGTSAARLGSAGRILQALPLAKGVAYQGSVWARGKGTLVLEFYEYRSGPGQDYAGGVGSGALALTDEWQQFHLSYSQGPNETQYKGLCFAVSGVGKDAAVTVDDALLEKTPLPASPPNLLTNPELRDADGDGLPDGWRGEQRRLRVEAGPQGVGTVRCAATLFSQDYQPAPDYSGWWSWARWGEQHGSGWPALPRPLGGAYTVLLESAPVVVEPARRYDVQLLVRELEVWGEFIGVRWFDAAGKPAAEFEERIGYYHMEGSSADWCEYVGRVTAPQTARRAAVVVGCKLSSGTLWVARPALVPGLGAPSRHEPRSERKPAAMQQGCPTPEATSHAPVAAAAAGSPGVRVTDTGLVVTLRNGVICELPLRDGRLCGITTVSCNGARLRNPQAPPLAPVIETVPRREYTDCRYQGWDRDGDGLVIHSSLHGPDHGVDRLEWRLAPTTTVLAGRRYLGMSYQYRFTPERVRVRRIMDRATWELGGTPLGLQVGPNLLPLGTSSAFCLESAYRFVAGDAFDYQTSPRGTLVSYLERCHTSLLMRAATPDFLILQDTFLFPDAEVATTTIKHVLYCPEPGDADEWAQVRDAMVARFREQLGAPPERALEPAAMILGWDGFKGVAGLQLTTPKPTRPDYYRWVAEQAIPRLWALGFKRVMLVLGMAPWNWPGGDITDLGPEYAEPFRALCEAAHHRGMTVLSWYGTAQTLDKAALWQQHPEFVLKGPDGGRAPAYYSPWGWPGNLAAGFADFTLNRLRVIRLQTGLDGLWLDSYSSASHLMDTAQFCDAVFQADALLPWQAQMEKHGFYTYCEGNPTCLGTVSTSGWEPPDDWSRFRAERYYKQGLYLQQPHSFSGLSDMGRFLADPKRRHYYRMLANRCCPILDMGHFAANAEAIALIGQANREFNAVCDLMQERHLLGDQAVEWCAPGGRAVFAFEDYDYEMPAGMTIRDVTEGKSLPARQPGPIVLRAYHTYRLEVR